MAAVPLEEPAVSQPPEPRSVRDELATLRIDRSPPPRKAADRQRALYVGGAVALFLLVALPLWWIFAGGARAVRVDYAVRSEAGSATAAAAPVLSGSGYIVTGEKYISIGVRVAGRIDEYLVDEAERVKAGQPLVRLDSRDYEATLSRAEANLRVAQANLRLRQKELGRLRELRAREVASEAELDVKRNEVEVTRAQIAQLEAEIELAKVNLDYTVLRAPTDGVILAKLKEVGEIAVPGGFAGSGDLIRMANLEDLRAEVDVNEADLARVRLRQSAEVTPDAYPDRKYPARVVKLYPQVNRQKGTLKVEVKLDAPDEKILPDMSVRITFLGEPAAVAGGEAGAAVVLAPKAALRTDAAGAYVWVVSQGHVRRQPVTTSAEHGDRAVVASGLLGGEALVVGEAEGLSEGDAVEVAPNPDSP
jgi:RND family efflux transporter MFP subunit